MEVNKNTLVVETKTSPHTGVLRSISKEYPFQLEEPTNIEITSDYNLENNETGTGIPHSFATAPDREILQKLYRKSHIPKPKQHYYRKTLTNDTDVYILQAEPPPPPPIRHSERYYHRQDDRNWKDLHERESHPKDYFLGIKNESNIPSEAIGECNKLYKQVERNRKDLTRYETNDTANESKYDCIRDELRKQEDLINSYQKENDRLTKIIRKLKYEKNGGTGYHTNVKNRKGSNTKNEKKALRNLSKKQLEEEIEELQKQLACEKRMRKLEVQKLRIKADVAEKEKELIRDNLSLYKNSLRESKKELQSTCEKILKMQTDFEVEKQQHVSIKNKLINKLEWYTKNQELLNCQLDTLETQRKEIHKLRGILLKDGKSYELDSEENERNEFRNLKAKLKDLERRLQNRDPDCISNLIRASGPSEDELKARG